jgi:outer membrane protein assembly factor BamA
MDLAFMPLGQIRGRLFFDVGAAWWVIDGQKYNQFFQPGFTFMEGGTLVDGVSSYGVGLDLLLFGLPMHFDWTKIWNFDEQLGDTQFEFWIGVGF